VFLISFRFNFFLFEYVLFKLIVPVKDLYLELFMFYVRLVQIDDLRVYLHKVLNIKRPS